MSFVNLKSDLYSALVNEVVREICCDTELYYNGTRLYMWYYKLNKQSFLEKENYM